MNHESKWSVISLCAVLVVAALLYLPSLDYDFVWDDPDVLGNEIVASGRAHWTEAFTLPVDRLYRPLRTLSFLLEARLYSLPGGYHFTNILLFLFTCTTLLFFLFTLTKDRLLSLGATFLYSVHPVHAETVAWVTGGRANLLAAPLVFLSLTFYLMARGAEQRRGAVALKCASWAAFALALLSKESALVVPLLIALIEIIFPRGADDSAARRARGAIAASVAYFLIGITYFAVRTTILGDAGQTTGYHGGSLAVTLTSMLPIFADYVRILIAPVSLCAVYVPEIFTSATGPVLFAAFALATLAGGALLFARRAPIMAFGILWFFITLLPVANIIPIASMKANRFLTLPAAGACLALALIIISAARLVSSRLWMRLGPALTARSGIPLDATRAKLQLAVTVSFILIVGALFFTASARHRNIWRNDLTLWTAAVACAPNSFLAHNNLARACFDKGYGNREIAMKALERAVELNPYFPTIRKNLGSLYASEGRYEDAMKQFMALRKLSPDELLALRAIPWLFVKLGRQSEAIAFANKELARPDLPEEARAELFVFLKAIDEREAR